MVVCQRAIVRFARGLLLWCGLPALLSAQSSRSSPSSRARIAAVRCDAQIAPAAPRLSWRGAVVQTAEWPVQLGLRAVANRIVVVRMPSAAVSFSLEIAKRGERAIPWSLADAPADAIVALNAGQFTDAGPWGWVVHKSVERQPPGAGTLAGAFVVDSAGAVAIVSPDELPSWRAPLRAVEAVQSYPLLLVDGARAPAALCDAHSGLDLEHRDARLAIGVTADQHVLIALSRFEMAPGVATRVPIGPTTPEMAEIMRQLGAVRAVMLDGGLSAQLLVRSGGSVQRWPGLRDVPLALVARLRTR